MAIGTYSELKTAIANWLNRTDLTDRIPEFIDLAEARMKRDGRLRVGQSVIRATLSVSSQFTTLPADFVRMINMEYDDDPVVPMVPLSPQQMDEVRAQDLSGDPKYYCVLGNGSIEVLPVQSSAASCPIMYYSGPLPLSESNPTNWLFEAAPDIYLYAAKIEACLYQHEDERAALFEGLYNQRCEEFRMSSEEDQSGGPLTVRGPTFP